MRLNRKLNPLTHSIIIAMMAPGLAIAQSGDNRLQLEEVVVTAEKIESTAQETSRAISVIGAAEIQDTGAANLTDALLNVPGFGYGAAMDQPSMRGVGLDFTDTGQMTPLVSINVDGAGAFGGARGGISSGVNSALFDVDRIEVVRGPSGTMVGQNALAGSVNIVTRKPVLNEWSFNGSVGFGNYDSQSFNLGGNIPLGDTLAIRLAYGEQEHDCYSRTVSADGTVNVCGNNWEDIKQGRALVLWQPTDNLGLTLGYNYSQDGSRNGVNGNPDRQDPWTSVAGGPPGSVPTAPTRNPGPKNHRYTAELTWDTDYGTLTVLPTYTVSEPFVTPLPAFCLGPGAPQGGPCTPQEDETRETWEVRFNSKQDQTLEWVVGALKDDQSVNSGFARGGQVSLTPNTAGVIDPNLAKVLDDFNNANPGSVGVDFREQRTYPPRNTESLYANLTYHLTEDLRLMAGFRYAKDNSGGTYQFAAYGVGLPAGGADAIMWENTNQNGSYLGDQVTGMDFSAFPGSSAGDWTCLNCVIAFQADPYQYEGETNPNNYSAGIEYDLTDSSMIYFNWNTGYQAGGVEAFVIPVRLYPSQRINAYAFGSKNRFLDNTLELNIEAYIYDYENWHGNNNNFDPLVYPFEGTDYVLPYFVDYLSDEPLNGTLPYPTNFNKGGKPYRKIIESFTSYGIEADMRALISENDRVTANLSMQEAKFPDYVDNFGNNLKGQRLSNAPLISARVSYEHDFHVLGGTLSPRMDVKIVSDTLVTNERSNFRTGVLEPNLVTQTAYLDYDAYLNYQHDDGHFSVNFYVRNLENDAEVLQRLPIPGGGGPGGISEPRTYGATLSFNY